MPVLPPKRTRMLLYLHVCRTAARHQRGVCPTSANAKGRLSPGMSSLSACGLPLFCRQHRSTQLAFHFCTLGPGRCLYLRSCALSHAALRVGGSAGRGSWMSDRCDSFLQVSSPLGFSLFLSPRQGASFALHPHARRWPRRREHHPLALVKHAAGGHQSGH